MHVASRQVDHLVRLQGQVVISNRDPNAWNPETDPRPSSKVELARVQDPDPLKVTLLHLRFHCPAGVSTLYIYSNEI